MEVVVRLGRKTRGPELFYGAGYEPSIHNYVPIRYEILQYVTINGFECVIAEHKEYGYALLECSTAYALVSECLSEEEILGHAIRRIENATRPFYEIVRSCKEVSQDVLRDMYKRQKEKVEIKPRPVVTKPKRTGFFS